MSTETDVLHITFAKAHSMLAGAVERKPEGFAYCQEENSTAGCAYVHGVKGENDHTFPQADFSEAESGCIIGDVLMHEGFTPQQIVRPDALHNHNTNVLDVLSTMRHRGLLTYTKDAYALFDKAQSYQDSGVTWNDAVARAVKCVQTARGEDIE